MSKAKKMIDIFEEDKEANMRDIMYSSGIEKLEREAKRKARLKDLQEIVMEHLNIALDEIDRFEEIFELEIPYKSEIVEQIEKAKKICEKMIR